MSFNPEEHLGRYKVIQADCPWQYANWSDKAHGAAISHYKTENTLDTICKVPVAQWADPAGCLLGMWATWPKLDHAFVVMADWGFQYITGWPWVKVTAPALKRNELEARCGIGFWGQHTSEVFLIGRRGKFKRENKVPRRLLWVNRDDAPDSDDPYDRVLYHPVGKHSEKPPGVHDWLQEQSSGPLLELYGRKPRDNWTVWGSDLGFWLDEKGVTHIV